MRERGREGKEGGGGRVVMWSREERVVIREGGKGKSGDK